MSWFVLLAAALAGCTRDPAPPGRVTPLYSRGTGERGAGDRASLERESRFVVRGSRTLPVEIPAGARFEVGYGIVDDAWRDDGRHVDFRITCHATGAAPHVLFEQRVEALAKGNRWHDAVLDLAPCAGATDIALDVQPPTIGEAAVWSNPRVVVPGPAAAPNIILVSIDTLRADHLGAYGYGRATSPRIDRLAADGVRFANVIASSSWTMPAHASMLTGLDPANHGGVVFDYFRPLSPKLEMLAERLWDAGYATAGFTGGGFVCGPLGYDQGYERYRDNPVSKGENDTLQWVLDHARPWIAAQDARPFFLFLHTYQVHMPYTPPPPYDTLFDPDYAGPFARRFELAESHRFLSNAAAMPPGALAHVQALYDGEIRAMDEAFGGFIDWLQAQGLAGNTCLLLTSDHGEEFGEHGGLLHQQAKLYEELIRIPLIVWCPSRIAGGRVIDDLVSHPDIVPTVLELAGLPVPEGVFDGRSLVPLLRGESLPERRPAISEVDGSVVKRPGRVRALRGPRYKLIESSIDGREELFDLADDPGEQRSLAATRGELARTLRAAAASAPRTAAPTHAAPAMTPDDALRERLRALGYEE